MSGAETGTALGLAITAIGALSGVLLVYARRSRKCISWCCSLSPAPTPVASLSALGTVDTQNKPRWEGGVEV